jgi:hypothetical protein
LDHIAVSIPEDVHRTISIQIVGDKLVIRGREGDFRKSYSFPKGTRPIEFRSEYIRDHKLLVIRLKVRRENVPPKNEDF